MITDLDGDGWDAYDANLGAPWTSLLDDVNSDVWGSGAPVSGRGVAFSGPPTLGQSGLFDDHIAESSDLAADLGLLSADWIHFDFYQVALTYSPNALSVFVRDHESHDWYLNISAPALAGWTSYTVSLAPAAGWYSPTGGISFADALSGAPPSRWAYASNMRRDPIWSSNTGWRISM